MLKGDIGLTLGDEDVTRGEVSSPRRPRMMRRAALVGAAVLGGAGLYGCPSVPPPPVVLDLPCSYADVGQVPTTLEDYLSRDMARLVDQCQGIGSNLTNASVQPDAAQGDKVCALPDIFLTYFPKERRGARVITGLDKSAAALFGRAFSADELSHFEATLLATSAPRLLVDDEPISAFTTAAEPVPDVSPNYSYFAWRYDCKGYVDAQVAAKVAAGADAEIGSLKGAISASAGLTNEGNVTLVVVDGDFRSGLSTAVFERDASGVDPLALQSRYIKSRLAYLYAGGKLAAPSFLVTDFHGTVVVDYGGSSVSGRFELDANASGAATTGVASASFSSSIGAKSSAGSAANFVEYAFYVRTDPGAGDVAPQPVFASQQLPGAPEIADEFGKINVSIDSSADSVQPSTVSYAHVVDVPGLSPETCAGWKVDGADASFHQIYADAPATITVVGTPIDADSKTYPVKGCRFLITGPVALDRTLLKPSVHVSYSLVNAFTGAPSAVPLSMHVGGEIPIINQPIQQPTGVSLSPIVDTASQPSGSARIDWNQSAYFIDDQVPIDFSRPSFFALGTSDSQATCQSTGGKTYSVAISPPLLGTPSTASQSLPIVIMTSNNQTIANIDLVNVDVCTFKYSVYVPLKAGGVETIPMSATLNLPRGFIP
jgi:hypothetical protein